jgi:3-hydroxy-9,10-secoandrosta-1,3,5(10)-triene-9,17-dione monooxygenase reductase component
VDSVDQAEPPVPAHRIPHDDVPDGMRHDARETWPSHDLIESWLGDSMYDFQFRPGEDVLLDEDDPAAIAAARQFRDVLGRFASGVTVVTAISGGAPVGLTCQSFSSVSLNPPLVLFIPAKTSRAWPAIQRSGKFCVNFLADGQAELSNQMASKGVDKFADVAWTPAPATGSPLIHDTLAYVDCQIQSVHEAGDHYVVIGRVLDLGLPEEDSGIDQPLLFFRGQYATTDVQNA